MSVTHQDNVLRTESLTELSTEDLAKRANDAAADVRDFGAATVDAATKAGMYLIAAKEKCGRGHWTAWLEANWHHSKEYARRFMKLAEAKRNSCPVLDSDHVNQDSIIGALRAIAAKETVKEKSAQAGSEYQEAQEAKEAKILVLLREGMSWSEIGKRVKCNTDRIKAIYWEHVLPGLLEIDWESRAKSALVKGIQAVKDKEVILATVRKEGYQGGWQGIAMERLGITKAEMDASSRIVMKGCPALVSRVEAGDISLFAARQLAALPQDEQMEQLKDKQRKRVVDAFDELRSRASTLLDQKLGWQQLYGRNGKTLRDLAQSADTEELSEVIKCFKTVAEWCSEVIGNLEGE
jgi:hypothetical protein|tara:strand:+ start:46 stop:1098 length:1053 start_codon:yes stop_codon:yes gene_type:complete